MRKSFSDKLTPLQIQAIFDALELDWRPYYNPKNDGWVNFYPENYIFNSDLSINILHGGWVDQYCASQTDNNFGGIPIRGDIVSLVSRLVFESTDPLKGIEWIKHTLGFKTGAKPPELKDGAQFANEYLRKENENKFARIPIEILHSKLKPSSKIVWMEIFNRVGKNEIYSFAGVRNISKRTKLSTNTVQRSLAELEEAGLIIQRPARVGQKHHRFPLVVDKARIDANLKTNKKTVPKMNTLCVQNEYAGVVKMNTELDPLNYTQLTKPRKLISATSRYAPFYFSVFNFNNQNITKTIN